MILKSRVEGKTEVLKIDHRKKQMQIQKEKKGKKTIANNENHELKSQRKKEKSDIKKKTP